jgi:hypothetical protein
MKNKFTMIKTIEEGGEIFYGVKDSFGNVETMISVSADEVQDFVNALNESGDVDFIHIPELIENFFYDRIEK